jgi:5-methyltetrahydrofolate--homocysteine methyltransferase
MLPDLVRTNGIVLADGGMATALQQRGVRFNGFPETLLAGASSCVEEVHRQFAEAGAHIVLTNTFGLPRAAAQNIDLGLPIPEIARLAASLAKASGAHYIAGSLGPTGTAGGGASHPAVRSAYLHSAEALASAGVDCIWLETIYSGTELETALKAVREVWQGELAVTFTPTQCGTSLPDGTSWHLAVEICMAAAPTAIGVNCGYGATSILPAIAHLSELQTGLPLIAKPNAGMPLMRAAVPEYPLSPHDFASDGVRLKELGAGIIGGCCGAQAAHIASLRVALEKTRTGHSTHN